MMESVPALIGRRQSTTTAILVLSGAVLLVMIALAVLLRAVEPDHVIPVHHYGGVEWQGDDCRVLDLGVIVCRGPIG